MREFWILDFEFCGKLSGCVAYFPKAISGGIIPPETCRPVVAPRVDGRRGHPASKNPSTFRNALLENNALVGNFGVWLCHPQSILRRRNHTAFFPLPPYFPRQVKGESGFGKFNTESRNPISKSPDLEQEVYYWHTRYLLRQRLYAAFGAIIYPTALIAIRIKIRTSRSALLARPL